MKITKFTIVTILLVLGMFSGLFLLYEHFVPSASEFCSFGENVDCGIVNKSPYSTADGIMYLLVIDWEWPLPYFNLSDMNPVFHVLLSNAFLGVLTLLLIWFMLYRYENNKDFWFIKHDKLWNWLIGVLIFGVAYGMYLFYVQHNILKTYCPFCITIDAVMILSLILVWKMKEEAK